MFAGRAKPAHFFMYLVAKAFRFFSTHEIGISAIVSSQERRGVDILQLYTVGASVS